MPRPARLLVSAGFLWITLWAVVGSLLGARINRALSMNDTIYVQGLQRELMRTAHAHMNSLSYGIILMGLTWVPARRYASERTLILAAWSAVAGTAIFGLGMVLEAFYPTVHDMLSPATAFSALGGLGVMFAFGTWGIVFLRGAVRP